MAGSDNTHGVAATPDMTYDQYLAYVNPTQGWTGGGDAGFTRDANYVGMTKDQWDALSPGEKFHMLAYYTGNGTSGGADTPLFDNSASAADSAAFQDKFGTNNFSDKDANGKTISGAPGAPLEWGYGDLPTQFGESFDKYAIDPSRVLRLPDGRWVIESSNIKGNWLANQQNQQSAADHRNAMLAVAIMASALGGAALAGGAAGAAPAVAAGASDAGTTGGFLSAADIAASGAADSAGAAGTAGAAGAAGAAGDESAGLALGNTADESAGLSMTPPGEVGPPADLAPPPSSAPPPGDGLINSASGEMGPPADLAPPPGAPAEPPPASTAPPPGTADVVDHSLPSVVDHSVGGNGLINGASNGWDSLSSWYKGLSPASRFILGQAVGAGVKGVMGAVGQHEAQQSSREAEERHRQDVIRQGQVPVLPPGTFTYRPPGG